MKLPDSLTKVTWFSKMLAMFIFTVLPFFAFLFGYKYHRSITVCPVDNCPQKSTDHTFSKNKNNDRDFIVGIWQSSGGMAAGWSDRYHFYPSGRFHFYISEMDCSTRNREKIGLWSYRDNILTLVTLSEKKIVGGQTIKSSGSCGTDTDIINGQLVEIKLPVPVVKNIKITKAVSGESDNYPTFMFDQTQFWKFNNDATGFSNEFPDNS